MKDFSLISPLIEALGHTVHFIQFDEPHEETYPLVICLEVVSRNLARLSEMPPWLAVNAEWLNPESIKVVQRHFGRVLCKTHESHRICAQLFGEKAHYVGFMSEDRFEPNICREKTILHVAGHSQVKNTTAVIDAWRWKRNGESLNAKLIVVSDFEFEDLPEGVTVLHDLSDDMLRNLQNVCQIHLQPSAWEGFGHVLHEAMSVNASILTVDEPPMNEIHAAYKIRSTGSTLFNSVKMHEVSAIDIHKAVQDMLRLGRNGFAAAGMPRKEFLDGNETFKKAFASEFATLETKKTRVKSAIPCIAFIGNFENEHSTENHILYALQERLGYDVEKLQENRINGDDIRSACEYSNILMWVRTPTWLKVPHDEIFEILEWCKRREVRTCSLHLDKFWGIPERECLIGKIPFWKTQFVFTADGSRQEDFAKVGVNHFWMKPAVSEVFCHPGIPRDEYRCDVGFVGAKNYHGEYPFRKQMVEFLQETYGNRFRHVEGVRGHLLNDVYQSLRVCVGDCFQSGVPMYWSDRVPETCGRYGLLLHPKVHGLQLPIPYYEPQNLISLKNEIDRLLALPERETRAMRAIAAEQVIREDTWTERLQEILEVVTSGD